VDAGLRRHDGVGGRGGGVGLKSEARSADLVKLQRCWAWVVKMADCPRLCRGYPPYNGVWFLMGWLGEEIPASAAAAFAGTTGGGSLAMIWEKVVYAGLRRHGGGWWMGRYVVRT
jgi:hypothetical protein